MDAREDVAGDKRDSPWCKANPGLDVMFFIVDGENARAHQRVSHPFNASHPRRPGLCSQFAHPGDSKQASQGAKTGRILSIAKAHPEP